MFLPLNVSWSEPRQKLGLLSGSPGLVVMGDDSCLKGCVFKSRRRILDGHFDIFHIDLLYRLFCLFEKAKNKQKRGRVPPPKKASIFVSLIREHSLYGWPPVYTSLDSITTHTKNKIFSFLIKSSLVKMVVRVRWSFPQHCVLWSYRLFFYWATKFYILFTSCTLDCLKNGVTLAYFSFIFVFSNTHYKLYNK